MGNSNNVYQENNKEINIYKSDIINYYWCNKHKCIHSTNDINFCREPKPKINLYIPQKN